MMHRGSSSSNQYKVSKITSILKGCVGETIHISAMLVLYWVITWMQWLIFDEFRMSKQRNFCLLWMALCDQSSWTNSHVMLWVHKNRVHGRTMDLSLPPLTGCKFALTPSLSPLSSHPVAITPLLSPQIWVSLLAPWIWVSPLVPLMWVS